MPPETTVVDAPRTGAINGAGAPPAASSPAPDAPPAKADRKPQAPAKPESKDDAKGPNGWIPKARFDEVGGQRDEARGKLAKLEEKGIYDDETAEQLLQQVEEGRQLRETMSDPVAHATQWSQTEPESFQQMSGHYVSVGRTAELNELLDVAKQYRSKGQEAEADFIEKLVQTRSTSRASQPAPAQPPESRDDGRLSARAHEFHEDVKEGAHGTLSRLINEFTADAELDEEDKKYLNDRVRATVAEAMDKDQVFMRGLDRFYDPRNGYTREMRSQAQKAYEKRLKVGGLVENAVKGVLSKLTTKTVSESQRRTGVPDAARRNREAAAGGPAAAGTVTQEDREGQKAAINKDYAEGKISKSERNSRFLRLPRVS